MEELSSSESFFDFVLDLDGEDLSFFNFLSNFLYSLRASELNDNEDFDEVEVESESENDGSVDDEERSDDDESDGGGEGGLSG